MKNAIEKHERGEGRSGLRAALAFGIIAATIEMALLLWLMYC